MKNKQKLFVLFSILLVITTFGALKESIARPPPEIAIRGYVKDNITLAPISGARVKVYGKPLYGGGYVYIGSTYTNSMGRYSLYIVDHRGPFKVEVSKSNYDTYYGYHISTVKLQGYTSLRVTGRVLEDETIDEIQVPNTNSLSLNVNPDGLVGYTGVIENSDVFVEILDCEGICQKKVRCSRSAGSYDTSLMIRKGLVTIRAFTFTNRYQTKSVQKVIVSPTTLNINFKLEKNLDKVYVYGENSKAFDNFNNFQLKPAYYPAYLDFTVQTENPPTMIYSPINVLESDYWISTFLYTQGVPFSNLCRFNVQWARVSLFVNNHWTGDESFIKLQKIGYDASSCGYGSMFQWTLSANLGYSLGPDSPWSSKVSLGVTVTPSDLVRVTTHTQNDVQPSGWTRLGYIHLDSDGDALTLEKKMRAQWHIKIDNSQLQSVKQCGAHFTYKVVYEFLSNCHGIQGWSPGDGCRLDYRNLLTIEQIIGDAEMNHPSITVYNPRDYDYSYINGSHSSTDYWTSLLAGKPETLSI